MAGSGANVDDLVRRVKNQTLKAQVEGSKTKAEALGVNPKKGGPTILGRTFDIIQRPLYGIAEGVARAAEHAGADTPESRKHKGVFGDILGGIGGGLAGKHKTSFASTMIRSAEADKGSLVSKPIRENRYNITAAGGLVLDIGLDPTTYVGAGLTKLSKADKILEAARAGQKAVEADKALKLKGVISTAGKTAVAAEKEAKGVATAAKATKAEKAVATAAKIAEVSGAAEKAGEEAVQAALKEAISATGKGSLTSAEQAAIRKGARQQAVNQMVKDAGDKALTEAFDPKTRINLKFAGKHVGSLPAEKVFYPLAKPIGLAAKTESGQKVAKLFRTSALYPEKTLGLLRKHQARGVAQFERTAQEVRKLYHGLTPEELTHISHALEGDAESLARMGDAASSIKKEHVGSSSLHDFSGNYETLDDYRRAAKTFFKGISDEETAKFIMKEGDGIENYVYHYYENAAGNSNKIKLKRKNSIKEGKAGYTLKKAAAEGYKPVTNIDELMVRKAGKTYARMSQADITHAILREYGIKASDNEVIEAFKQGGTHLQRVGDAKFRLRHGPGAMDQMRKAGHLAANEELFLPDHIAHAIKNIDELHRDAMKTDKFFKLVDKVQQPWKFWATAANPGHHVRNMMGDVYLNFLDGVVDPRHYNNAMRLMLSKNPEKFTMKFGDKMLSGSDILKLYEDAGAKSGFFRVEHGASVEGSVKGLIKGGKEKIVNFAEKREDTGRLAHFMSALKDESKGAKGLEMGTTKMDDIADAAAARVRKWNIDYGDLTPFEAQYMKRIIPFYTWMRKNIPLQLEALAMRPGRVAAVPKVNRTIEKMLGTEGNYENAIIPKFIKEMAPISLVGEGEGKNGLYWVPNLPIQDISRFAEGGKEGILREVMSSTSPLLRIPFEQAFGEKLFSGAPIKGQGQYSSEQIPMAGLLYKLLKEGSNNPGEPTVPRFGIPGMGSSQLKMDRLLNYLSGMSVENIGESERASELRRQQDIAQAQVREAKDKIRKKALGK